MSEITLEAEWGMFADADMGDPSLPQNNLDTKDYADYTPNTATKLSDTPDHGVALPAEAIHAIISVETNPIRYRTGSVAPTAAAGTLLIPGNYKVTNQRAFLEHFWFIDTAAGASFVTVTYGRKP